MAKAKRFRVACEDLAWAAESAKCSVEGFIAMAVAEAILRELDEGDGCEVRVRCDHTIAEAWKPPQEENGKGVLLEMVKL